MLAFVWEAPSHAYAYLAVGMGAPYLVVGPFAGALVNLLSVGAPFILGGILMVGAAGLIYRLRI